MQNNYWIHVELFPETASEYSAAALDDLSIILLHARTGETILFVDMPENDGQAFQMPLLPILSTQNSSFRTRMRSVNG